MLYSTVAQIGFVVLVAVTGFVLWTGGGWARLSAGLHAVNWMLVAALQRRHEHHIFQTGDFIADLLGAGAACAIAVASRRLWAACLAAFQVLGVINYLVQVFDPRVLHRAFWTAAYIWEAGALACLLVAGAEALRARKRAGGGA
ncbi:hypothetical protein [Caulobacter sp. S45]|uniref:hypothetical protein n=1 Tax=Caulobacter sp. S45 TaxID=1641861 RepID=UPI00131DBF56|nr:hypothetical protein [Caulobacter sp. S45]